MTELYTAILFEAAFSADSDAFGSANDLPLGDEIRADLRTIWLQTHTFFAVRDRFVQQVHTQTLSLLWSKE